LPHPQLRDRVAAMSDFDYATYNEFDFSRRLPDPPP
jgi:hypothetical protein